MQKEKPIDPMNHLCKFRLSPNSYFYIGGPGTQFPENYTKYNAKILINSTNEKTENFTILPGVMNNLNRLLVHTGDTPIFYMMQYHSDNSDTEMIFVLPISGKCL